MKGLFNSSVSFISIKTILNFFSLSNIFNYKDFFRKIIIYSISFIFLTTAYVFGFIALYCYLLPYWGEALAAFALCLLSLIIGFSLILTGRLLKAKKKQATSPILPLLEKGLEHIPNSQDLRDVLAKASPKVLITVLGVAALATYILFSKKKDKY